MAHHRRAVTLIETLVAIAVIALLLALVAPALGAARATSKAAQCRSNLRQDALLMVRWRDEHHYFPTVWSAFDAEDGVIRLCPARPETNSYAIGRLDLLDLNRPVNWDRACEVLNPATIRLVGDNGP